MRKQSPIFIIATLLALLLASTTTRSTYAHAALVRTDPPDSTVLAEAPAEVRLWYNEPISVSFSTFQVLDLDGKPVELDGIRLDEVDPQLVILDMPEMEDGVYSIHWHVLSAADGHDTQGYVVFGVGNSTDINTAVVHEVQTAVPWLEVALRWFNYGLMALVIGAAVVVQIVLPRAQRRIVFADSYQPARHRILQLARFAALGSLIAGVGLYLYQMSRLMANLATEATWLGTGWELLVASRWGWLWLGRQAVFAALFFLFGRMQKQRAASLGILASVLVVATAVLQALNSHAAAVTDQLALALLADTLHVLAMGVWLGGVVALLVGIPAALTQVLPEQARQLRKAAWRIFGPVAAVAVALLVFSGLVSAGFQVATPDAMLTSFYGQTLLTKIGLMLLMGLFGLINSATLNPRVAAPLARLLKKPAGWTPFSVDKLSRLVLLEATLGLVVLFATGIVTASPTAVGPSYLPYPDKTQTSTMTQSVEDMIISFSSKPNLPGQNIFVVRATSHRRPAPAEVAKVILRFTYLEEDLGTVSVDAQEINETSYRLGGGYFSLPGRWHVDVAVRRLGVEDSIGSFEWIVPPTSEPEPVVLSDQRLQPILLPLGFAGMSLMLLAGLVLWRRKQNNASIEEVLTTSDSLVGAK
ncbi:MAG: copper resistance protein CopC/CopD [Anaerolineales bacterium]|nr:copper resistance protein CopC/CopD [Anaerolineales bacterium]MCB8940196.1 copper resistance protein CopC/CopD [Ardenticatenaceae bacterium]